jgi:hypothetical protein
VCEINKAFMQSCLQSMSHSCRDCWTDDDDGDDVTGKLRLSEGDEIFPEQGVDKLVEFLLLLPKNLTQILSFSFSQKNGG